MSDFKAHGKIRWEVWFLIAAAIGSVVAIAYVYDRETNGSRVLSSSTAIVEHSGTAGGVSWPINETCPRSGKPIEFDSLAAYRGHTVGFCNTDCRDDFASNIDDRPQDRALFDKIIDSR